MSEERFKVRDDRGLQYAGRRFMLCGGKFIDFTELCLLIVGRDKENYRLGIQEGDGDSQTLLVARDDVEPVPFDRTGWGLPGH